MDTMQTNMLQLMQAVTARPAAPAKQDAAGKDDFRKLMEQAANGGQQETPKADAAQDGEAGEVFEDPKLREQMMLAAAAMLQNPVVIQVQDPVAAVEEPVQTEVQPLEEFTAQPEETPVQPRSLAQTGLPKENAEQNLSVQRGVAESVETVEDVEVAEAPAAAQAQETVKTAQAPEEQREDEPENNLESGGETAVFRDVREVPVKVGEPAAAEQTTQAQPVETQVAEKLTEALKSGETRVEIQLTPENLGKVSVEVTMQEDGTLHVALHAENMQTRSLLERDATGLQTLLARNTQQEVQVEVSRQQESQRQNFYDGHQGQEHQNPQQQRRNRQSRESAEDFLHQLRLGLIPAEAE